MNNVTYTNKDIVNVTNNNIIPMLFKQSNENNNKTYHLNKHNNGINIIYIVTTLLYDKNYSQFETYNIDDAKRYFNFACK